MLLLLLLLLLGTFGKLSKIILSTLDGLNK